MVSIRIEVRPDEKGYLDRQCPNEQCCYVFKVFVADLEDKGSEELHCPMCGRTARLDQWATEAQIEQMREVMVSWARSHMTQAANRMFQDVARTTGWQYRPGRPVSFVNSPIVQCEEWVLDITCEGCGARFSVIGSAYFCPCCGHNAVGKVFLESLDTVEKQVLAMDRIKEVLTEQFGPDKAETMCRAMIEGTLAGIVSAFQKYAESRFTALSTREVKVNDFQRVADGSQLFRDQVGRGYDTWLTPDELKAMNLMLQRRHLLEHNNGLVDARYLKKTGDTSYTVGQRLVVKPSDAADLLAIVRRLGKGLADLAPPN